MQTSSGRLHYQVWLVQAFCNRGTLMDGIEQGLLKGADGKPNLLAVLQTGEHCQNALLACIAGRVGPIW